MADRHTPVQPRSGGRLGRSWLHPCCHLAQCLCFSQSAFHRCLAVEHLEMAIHQPISLIPPSPLHVLIQRILRIRLLCQVFQVRVVRSFSLESFSFTLVKFTVPLSLHPRNGVSLMFHSSCSNLMDQGQAPTRHTLPLPAAPLHRNH
jgi:hypothetical protein